MKDIYGFTCTYCGAPLPADVGGTAICDFCGATVLLSPDLPEGKAARASGYAFELGRYDAQNSPSGRALAEKIQALLQALEKLETARERVVDRERKRNAAQQACERFDWSSLVKLFAIPLLFPLFSYTLSWFYVENSFFFSWVLAFIVFLFLLKKRRSIRTQAERRFAVASADYDDACRQLQQLENAYDFSLIPEEYREKEPMLHFVKTLSSGRAMSLQQAIAFYEEDQHRNELYRLQAEQIALQNQQLELQRQQLQAERDYREQQLELEKQKKASDYKAALAVAGSIAAAAITLRKKRR